MDKIFNFTVFEKELDTITKEGKELSLTEIEAHNIINTISDYVDCHGDFVMNISDEGIDAAIEIVYDKLETLTGMIAATKVFNLLDEKKLNRKVIQKDLF